MNNKLLEVILEGSNQTLSDFPIEDEMLEQYIGGRGLAVKLFTQMVSPDIIPLSKDNALIFTIGPFSGTAIPTNGRFSLVTKSPLTNGIFYSNSGGFFGPELKKCGFDGIIIKGESEKPVYLVIDNKDVSIKDATSLWGLNTEKTLEKLKEIEGNNIKALLIGPAGENLVRISSIMNQAERAFGRGGVGSVMGSKKLKAIVVKNGKSRTEIKDPEHLKKLISAARDKIKVAPITRSSLPKFGTSALVNVINELGLLPIRNFQAGYDERASNVSGEAIREQLLVKEEGCFACPIRCGRLTKAGDMSGKGPEYESVWALGPNLGIFDLETVAQANYLCNQLGIDTISCGGTISCAMELQQMGKLNDKNITFGNASILKDLVKKIAYKDGIGAELADGSKILSEKYGAPDVSIQVKGMELPAYDPRGAVGHALGYATSNRGGDHLTGYLAAMEIFAAPKKINRFNIGGKADLLFLKQNAKATEDSLVMCAFAGWALGFDFYSRFLTAITGIEYTVQKLMDIGERIYNLERLYNLAAGIDYKEDKLPPRFLNTPFTEGFSKGVTVPLQEMLKDYYAVRNWDENGIPKGSILLKLGLDKEPLIKKIKEGGLI